MTSRNGSLRSTKLLFAGAMALATLGAQAATPKSSCAPTATAEADITAVARSTFAAARADDLPGFRALTTADFYAYDNGLLLSGDDLMSLIKQAHAAGKKYEWSVTEPKVHFSCNLGWITYVNKGSIEDASGKRDMTWLESEVLEYGDGHWRIHFLHSTRAAPSPAPKPAS